MFMIAIRQMAAVLPVRPDLHKQLRQVVFLSAPGTNVYIHCRSE